MVTQEFDNTLDQYREALNEFVKGNSKPFTSMISHEDDVTLYNPWVPVARGWNQVEQAADFGATKFREGRVISFENLTKVVTDKIAYVVGTEQYETKVGGEEEPSRVALRVTSIFRREEGTWKVVHRHADPLRSGRAEDIPRQE
jgi:ketosteroid isomerase-like protein